MTLRCWCRNFVYETILKPKFHYFGLTKFSCHSVKIDEFEDNRWV